MTTVEVLGLTLLLTLLMFLLFSFAFVLGYMRATDTEMREALVQLFRNESEGGEA